MSQYKYEQFKSYNQILLIIAVVLVAFNLRAAINVVGPLAGLLRDNLAITNWSIGILTSLPLFAFAFMSPLAPKIGAKYTNEVALIAGMCVLSVGLVMRSIAFIPLLFGGTLLIGIGISISNVLLPGIIKERFPNRVPMMTSIYTTAMSLFAALASGVSLPLAVSAGLGWQVAMGIWIIPAFAAIAIWTYFIKKRKSPDEVRMHYVTASDVRMWRSPLAWQVAIFFGLQAFVYNALMTWLPEILVDYGVSAQTGGWMLSFNQFIGLPASLLIPIIAGKFKSQRIMVLILCSLALSGFSGLFFGNSFGVMVGSIVALGIALGGLFPLSLTFIGLRAKNAQDAAELSGMAQAVGYLLAAIGPIFIGSLVDLTGTWKYSLIILFIIVLVAAAVGLGAGRYRVVTDDYEKYE